MSTNRSIIKKGGVKNAVPVHKKLATPLPYINMEPTSFGPGVWFSTMCDALRARTDAQIDFFIQFKVPLLTSLLCITCSNEAFKLIKARHPRDYRNITDKRGERIGMFLWVFDLHNDVNRRLREQGDLRHTEYTLEEVSAIYAPLLDMTTRELDEEKKWAQTPEGMDNLYAIEFQSGPPTIPIVDQTPKVADSTEKSPAQLKLEIPEKPTLGPFRMWAPNRGRKSFKYHGRTAARMAANGI